MDRRWDTNPAPQVNAHDEDDRSESLQSLPSRTYGAPSSPPPSFHSRSSSPSSRRLLREDPHSTDADQTLADTFGEGNDSDDDDEPDDRQRLMRANVEPADSSHAAASRAESSAESQNTPSPTGHPRSPTILPSFTTPTPTTTGSSRVMSSANDGVFANLAAKPERGEKTEDLPPVRSFFALMPPSVISLYPGY